MKRFFITIIVFIFFTRGYSQGSIALPDKPFLLNLPPDTAIQNAIERNPASGLLTREEKNVIYWVNYVRQKPASFVKLVLSEFLDQFPDVKSAYTKSLIRELQKQPALPPLTISQLLIKAARAHAHDLSQHHEELTHNSSSGDSFEERMALFGFENCVSENIFQGKPDGLQAVILLLIDAGVENLGHRKNILDPDLATIGISFSKSKNSDHYFLVQDFSCGD